MCIDFSLLHAHFPFHHELFVSRSPLLLVSASAFRLSISQFADPSGPFWSREICLYYYMNSFTFNGSSVSVYGGKRSNYGNFIVTLDGQDTTHSAYSPVETSTLLFRWHELIVTNTVTDAGTTMGLDIDRITWNSTITNASITSEVDACVIFTFEVRQAISLFGPIGAKYASSYHVSLDGFPPRTFFSANRINETDALLYYADNLGAGNHTVKVTNGGGSTAAAARRGIQARQTETDSQSLLGINNAQVWQEETATVTTPAPSASPPPTSLPSPGTSNPQHTSSNLSTGTIVGIALGSFVFVSLLVLVLLLNRRNKTLWARLQKGYMIQSHSEPSSPRTGLDTTYSSTSYMRWMRIPFHQNKKVEPIEPYPFVMGEAGENTSEVSIARRHRRDRDGSKVYTPYRGFGKSRSKSHTASESVGSLTSSGSGGDYDQPLLDSTAIQPRPEPLVMPVNFTGKQDFGPGRETPSRSATLMTASTLVAEDGFTDEIDTAVSNKPFLKLVGRDTATPTTATFSADSALAFQLPRKKSQAPTTAGSGTRSSRMSSSSRFSRRSKRWTRSSSPSQRRLLHSDPDAHSDLEEYEYDDDDMGADFYAEDALGMVGGLRSPTASLARSQSDAQTPIRGRLEDESENEESSFSRVQIPSWLIGNGSMSFPSSFAASVIRADSLVVPTPARVSSPTRVPSPHRQTSKDTLPIYTSRVPTLDLPPPFPSPTTTTTAS
ncbi:hypothetical protein BT96DRAFT_913451 [Gymnopus androsaceus JB14]|uniref:Transmembrane protein n=1 Tax=Gymnopus androsaceus JB14 TaxID=1447944 RepID=A0A6A4IAX4_9AGAR|nr:hypothetical protein BT96DRAFT_913451 [Gymnopus androsaceus JB14]